MQELAVMGFVDAVEVWLGRLGDLDRAAAEVALLRSLARLLDAVPVAPSDLYREYRFAVRAVREALPDGGADGKVVSLLERLGDSALRNTAD